MQILLLIYVHFGKIRKVERCICTWERRKINEFHAFSESQFYASEFKVHYNCNLPKLYFFEIAAKFWKGFFPHSLFLHLVRSHTTFSDVISLKNGNANLINGCPETWKFMKWWWAGSVSASVLSFHQLWPAGWWMADGARCISILPSTDTSGWCCKFQSFSSGR